MPLNPDLTATIATPRRLTLAGRAYLVGELTFGSAAALQAWYMDRHPNPCEAVHDSWETLGRLLPANERARLVADAMAEAESYPPSPLTREGRRAIFADPEALVELVRLVIAQNDPEYTEHEAAALVREMTAEEWGRFASACWGVNHSSWLSGQLMTLIGLPDKEGADTDWNRVLNQLCADPYNFTPVQVAGLTPTQAVMLKSGGKWSPGAGIDMGNLSLDSPRGRALLGRLRRINKGEDVDLDEPLPPAGEEAARGTMPPG